MSTCPICEGSGLVVFRPAGDGGEGEIDQPCTECGQQGLVKSSRARALADKRDSIHSRLLSRRFGRQASHWRIR